MNDSSERMSFERSASGPVLIVALLFTLFVAVALFAYVSNSQRNSAGAGASAAQQAGETARDVRRAATIAAPAR